MKAWRITKRIHALDRIGTGGRLTGGRWNSQGNAAIYAGLTLEIAALEKLVHTGETLPADLVVVEISLPDEPSLYIHYDASRLPPGWDNLPSSASAVSIGDKALADTTHLGMIVPSAIIPEAKNIVINPNHPEMSAVTMAILRDFNFDPRLKR